MIDAKIIKDSINVAGKRITTMQIVFQRFILPEFNTHRVFSRNFSSSRAIPTKVLMEQVQKNPAMPVYWGKNQPGMQAKEELVGEEYIHAIWEWRMAAQLAASIASKLSYYKVHKQIVNRVLEPFLWSTGIVTSTEWDNFFLLRDHTDAQPEIHALASKMRETMNNSTPTLLVAGDWHLPYISKKELLNYSNKLLLKISAARCCRVSYLKHDGSSPSIEEDLALFNRLAGSVPIHASPLEHQATPNTSEDISLEGNFKGWIQYRKVWERKINACA